MGFLCDKIILDLCSGTGSWSRPYRRNGYPVIRIDVRDGTDVRVLEALDIPVHGILAGPPCTHLASSGARWWRDKGEEALLESLAIADACLRQVALHQPEWWCLENPIGRLSKYYGAPVLSFDPCDFGDPWTKKTCLWGKFTIPEKNPVEPTLKNYIHFMPDSKARADKRSATPPGFADAFFKANP